MLEAKIKLENYVLCKRLNLNSKIAKTSKTKD